MVRRADTPQGFPGRADGLQKNDKKGYHFASIPGKIILQNLVPETPGGAAPLFALDRAAVVLEDKLLAHTVHKSDHVTMAEFRQIIATILK